MHSKSFLPVLSLLLASTAAAQTMTTVVPFKYTSLEGSSSTAYPFGLTATSRVQTLFMRSLVAVPVMTVKQIATRGDGVVTTAFPAKSIDMEVGMTTTTTDWLACSTTFATNLGADYKTVYTRKLLNLPAPPTSGSPRPFVSIVPLDNSFLYMTNNGNLLIDWIQHTASTGSYNHDTGFTQSAVITPTGAGCGGLNQTVSGGTATALTSVSTFAFTGGPIGGAAVHALGSFWYPTPIPLPWVGCTLYQNVLMTTPVTVSGTGTGTLSYPTSPNFRGITVYGQYFAVDSTLTALTASQSHSLLIGGYDAQTRIYNLSSATSPTGTVQLGAAIVAELTY